MAGKTIEWLHGVRAQFGPDGGVQPTKVGGQSPEAQALIAGTITFLARMAFWFGGAAKAHDWLAQLAPKGASATN